MHHAQLGSSGLIVSRLAKARGFALVEPMRTVAAAGLSQLVHRSCG